MVRDLVPAVLPIFPLTGSLLLPGNYLPLNVFEPRYRNMVRDAMAGLRCIGMIQPRLPAADNFGASDVEAAAEVYPVGCTGWIRDCEPQPDGRFHVVLEGLVRFRVVEELEPRHGYRRVRVEYDGFEDDLRPAEPEIDTPMLVAAVERFGSRHGLAFDRDLLLALPPARLVNALSAALPFEPAEKQALLEAPSARERQEMLLALIQMDADQGPPAPADEPVVN